MEQLNLNVTIYDNFTDLNAIASEECLTIDKLPATTIILGQTMSGKSSILHSLINKKIIHEVDLKNIIIFSKTAGILDLSYRPLIQYYGAHDCMILIHREIDMELIKDIEDKQKA